MANRVQLPMISVGPGAANGLAPSMTMGQMANPNPLASHLAGLEQTYGLPQGYMAQIRAIESSNGKNLQNPNSSAAGPYQIIDKTMRGLGLTDADRMDEFKSATAIAKMASQDAAAFRSATGRDPTGADIYGMHQQGQAGYLGLLRGQTPGEAAQRLNAAGGMDAKGQLGVIQNMYANARPDLPGDPTTRFGAGFGSAQAGPAPAVPGGTSGGGTTAAPATTPAAPDPSKGTFNGGVMGLLQGDNYTGQGSSKDFMGRMGDFVASDKFKSGMAGIGMLMGGGGGKTVTAPGIQNLPAEDQENKPQMSLLQMLYGKGGVQSGGVLGR